MKGLSMLTSDLRDELLQELKEKAVQAGANAIVGLRLDQSMIVLKISNFCYVRMETNTIFEGVLDMVVYGTAVYFQR